MGTTILFLLCAFWNCMRQTTFLSVYFCRPPLAAALTCMASDSNQKVLYEGYLYKLGVQGLLNGYQKRWVTVYSKSATYSAGPRKEVLGTWDLAGGDVETVAGNALQFRIYGPKLARVFELKASNARERDTWVKVLREAIKECEEIEGFRFVVEARPVTGPSFPWFGQRPADDDKVWQSPAFIDAFVDPYLPPPEHQPYRPPPEGGSLQILRATLKSLSRALEAVVRDAAELSVSADMAEAMGVARASVAHCEALCGHVPKAGLMDKIMGEADKVSDVSKLVTSVMTPLLSERASQLVTFLQHLVDRVSGLLVGEMVLLPAGWQYATEDATAVTNSHALLLVLRRVSEAAFSLAVFNFGEGLGYHAVRPEAREAAVQDAYNMPLVVEDIPRERLTDSSFWFFLYKMLVFPSNNNGPRALYNVLLPYLNHKPLGANVRPDTDHWAPAPFGGDTSYWLSAVHAVRYIVQMAGRPGAHAAHTEVLVQWALMRAASAELAQARLIRTADAFLIRLACKGLARSAARLLDVEEGPSPPAAPLVGGQAAEIAQCIAQVEDRLHAVEIRSETITASAEPPALPLSPESGLSPQTQRFPLFGCFRKEVDVEALAGTPLPPRIVLPCAITSVQARVRTFNDVANSLRHCVHVCTILASQSDIIKDTFCIRAALIQNLFTEVLPVPLPFDHPQRPHKCFWASQGIRYETQTDILRLLNQVCRHFLAAVFSLRVTRSFDAARLVTMGCILAVADAAMRLVATDIPSQLALHYSGAAAGPVLPFGFSIGHFAVVSETLAMSTPALAAARATVLDYFESQARTGAVVDEHVLFKFEESMAMGEGERRLLTQVCLQMGLAHDAATLPLYLSGEVPWFLDLYPELGYFRDLVFMFKAMQAPSTEGLPDLRAWLPTEAALSWTYAGKDKDKEGRRFEVTGFGTKLQCVSYTGDPGQSLGQSKKSFFGKLDLGRLDVFGWGKKQVARAPPSSADPSYLARDLVENEEDVLYLQELPDFDGTLHPSDAELVLQYLTAPYVRIPLLLQLFTDKIRIKALGVEALQEVLDAALFEPALWQGLADKELPTHIPARSRAHLATPCGLLFNELLKSPDATLSAIEVMLDNVLERDAGKYLPESCAVVLYVIRLAVRVEDFLLFLIRNDAWMARDEATCQNTWATYVRGLQVAADTAARLSEAQRRLRAQLHGPVADMLQNWLRRALRQRRTDDACALHAHLAFLHRNLEEEELGEAAVRSLLTAQCYLNLHHHFDTEVKSRAPEKRGLDLHASSPLGIPDMELFSLFQTHKSRMYEWLQAHPDAADRVMEYVVRAVTTSQPQGADLGGTASRHWTSLRRHGCEGRFVPDTEQRDPPGPEGFEPRKAEAFRDWLLETTTNAADTEINVQLGTFTLRQNKVQVVDDWANAFPDFVDRFGRVGPTHSVPCAEVASTDARRWVRLITERHDVQLWTPDARPIQCPHSRSYPGGLHSGEAWVRDTLTPHMPALLQGCALYLPPDDCSARPYANLFAVVPSEAEHATGGAAEGPGALQEVVVLRDPPVIHVYQWVEHGRYYYRSLVYTSDAEWALHTPSPTRVGLDPYHAQHSRLEVPSVTAGNPRLRHAPAASLVIIRSLLAELGRQLYVPPRLLAGLLPHALLQQYEFWQAPDQSLVGYSTGPSVTPTRLLVTVSPEGPADPQGLGCHAAHATVQRVQLQDPGEGDPVKGWGLTAPEDASQPRMQLLNLLHSAPGTELRQLAKLLLRLSSLADVLVWAACAEGSAAGPSTIDVVELPLLNLTFEARQATTAAGAVTRRLYCTDHPSLFITNDRPADVVALIEGLGSALLLQTDQGDYFALVAASGVPGRVEVLTGQCPSLQPLSLFGSHVIFDHTNDGWSRRLGDMRHYLYPIHLSGAFLFTPNFAASLYLLLLRFLNRQYEAVFQMAPATVSDTPLTPEEQQIWDQLACLQTDFHPDAHACRLKLSLAMMGDNSVMACPWDMAAEMAQYCRKRAFVSAACRLTVPEETRILQAVAPHPAFRNRLYVLAAYARGAEVSQALEATGPAAPRLDDVDLIEDESVLDYRPDLFSSFSFMQYERPEFAKLVGTSAVDYLETMMQQDRLGLNRSNGFLFVYELLTGVLPLKLLPGDVPHNWGALLLRLFPASELQKTGPYLSALRILSRNPDLAKGMPALEDRRQLKIGVFLPGQQEVPKLLHECAKVLNKRKADIQWLDPATRDLVSQSPAPDQVCLSEAYFQSRSWTVPMLSDCASDTHCLAPFKEPGLALSPETAQALGDVPMTPLGLTDYIVKRTRQQRGLAPVAANLPFSIEHHRVARPPAARAIAERLASNVKGYAEDEAASTQPQLLFLLEDAAVAAVEAPEGPAARAAVRKLQALLRALEDLHAADERFLQSAKAWLYETGNATGLGTTERMRQRTLGFLLLRKCGARPSVDFESLVASLLSTSGAADLRRWNPFLDGATAAQLQNATAWAMLVVNRMGQTRRCLLAARGLLRKLQRSGEGSPDAARALVADANALAQNIAAGRHYTTTDARGTSLDPRFLLFEFNGDIVLRKAQVDLIRKFKDAVAEPGYLCHQMIMGAGKTTVVGPLLALILGDGERLVTQVVPHALLEFSRQIMRERFSAVIRKPVYTLQFDRYTNVTEGLVHKFKQAAAQRAVVCAQPTAAKSLVLKFLEMLHSVDLHKNASTAGAPVRIRLFWQKADKAEGPQVTLSSEQLEQYKTQSQCLADLFSLFKRGALILDEVDLILHPLKSELHWPLGIKEPLDFTRDRNGSPTGLRWGLVFHLVDALLYHSGSVGPSVRQFKNSAEAARILADLKRVIEGGVQSKRLQTVPHLVILSPDLYDTELRPLLAKWALLWLRARHLGGADDETVLTYLQTNPETLGADVTELLLREASDDDMRMLNLANTWLRSLLPHVAARVNRVQYGLLTPLDLQKALAQERRDAATRGDSGPEEGDGGAKPRAGMPQSRRLMAVPFMGKDVPTRASEFSHPDVLIGMTVLAYRYEGLRETDFKAVMHWLQGVLQSEQGPYAARRASKIYVEWVEEAGGHVRGTARKVARTPGASDDTDDLWPLHLVDLRDPEHVEVLYPLLARLPAAIETYLHELVFPATLAHSGIQLSASGQDLGGDMLFNVRLAFSGTPSDLLPRTLGHCEYARGDDARMLNVLTDPEIVAAARVAAPWSAESVLRFVATAGRFHALIDTGALITGMSNEQVARYLLTHGLPDMEGVVFLDAEDKQQVLLRKGLRICKLSQCGLPWHRRFTFYDQVHTTGMDIKQAIMAHAAVTLGKDMTFRDFAQGAYRMRGLTAGQRLTLLVIPEVAELIRVHTAAGAGVSVEQREREAAALSAAEQHKRQLWDVVAWLVVNTMRTEKVQADLLAQQNLQQLWRKVAFHALKSNQSVAFTAGHSGDMEQCIDVFRERVSHAVENSVPCTPPYSERLRAMKQQHEQFLTAHSADEGGRESQLLAVADDIISGLSAEETEAHEGASTHDTAMQHAFESEQVQEQEQEKEQEDEHQKENVDEHEKEVEIAEECAKQPYFRPQERPSSWRLASLAEDLSAGTQGFSGCSEFVAYTRRVKNSAPVSFPPYTLQSRGYYTNTGKCQRLKNVIIVMEWVPDYEKLAVVEPQAEAVELTEIQLALLREAFDMFDVNSDGGIGVRELKPLLDAIDYHLDKKGMEEMIEFMLQHQKTHPPPTPTADGTLLTFDAFRSAIQNHVFYRMQTGRHFVALSLDEAESLRGAIHMRQTESLLDGARAAVALRTLGCSQAILDCSGGFAAKAAPLSPFQSTTASQCYRFINSDLWYTTKQLHLLLRALQDTPCDARSRWFQQVKSCRRRPITAAEETPLAVLFSTPDGFHLLKERATQSRIRTLLCARGLWAHDAFRMFDTGCNGVLTMIELYRGLVYLGLRKVGTQEVRDLFQVMDTDKDGVIALEEFEEYFGAGEDEDCPPESPAEPLEPLEHGSIDDVVVPLNVSLSLDESAAVAETPELKAEALTRFDCRVKVWDAYDEVWNNRTISSRNKVSIWAPKHLEGNAILGQANKCRVSLGHYCTDKYQNPKSWGRNPSLFSFTDREVGPFGNSQHMALLIDRACPRPVRFRLVWSKKEGKQPLYVWAAVPPSSKHQAVGMVATVSEDPPSVDCMRCVPKRWLEVVPNKQPKKMWDDSGSSGQSGSFWIVNEFETLWVTPSHDAPNEPFRRMKSPDQKTYKNTFKITTDDIEW